jgi:hypothetical protein
MPQWVREPDRYVCELPPQTQLLALEELRETKHTRDEALEQMRDWIKKNPRILNCRLGKWKQGTAPSGGLVCAHNRPVSCYSASNTRYNSMCLLITDARFLLRFLRTKKFSTVQAQEALERYLLLRQAYAPAFRNLDYTDHTMNELISNGYIFTILQNTILIR